MLRVWCSTSSLQAADSQVATSMVPPLGKVERLRSGAFPTPPTHPLLTLLVGNLYSPTPSISDSTMTTRTYLYPCHRHPG